MFKRPLLTALVLLAWVVAAPASADGPEVLGPFPDHRIIDSDSITVTVGPEIWQISIDQRFFNLPGNEQRGLRATTSLEVPDGGEYLEPEAGDGYEDVACSDVSIAMADDVVAEGPGTWTAEAPGVHLVCYQQVPGAPGGSSPGGPGAEEPEVLGEAMEDGEAEDAAGATGSSTGTRVLASTGASITLFTAIALLMLVAGVRLVRTRRIGTERPLSGNA